MSDEKRYKAVVECLVKIEVTGSLWIRLKGRLSIQLRR
jgi:hypothetical protein